MSMGKLKERAMDRLEELRARQARDILLRMVANHPELADPEKSAEDLGVNLCIEAVQWLMNELFHCIHFEADHQLAERAENVTPDWYDPAIWDDDAKKFLGGAHA
jgi:hypothetical protein